MEIRDFEQRRRVQGFRFWIEKKKSSIQDFEHKRIEAQFEISNREEKKQNWG